MNTPCRSRHALCSSEMGNEFLRGHYLGLLGSHQVLEQDIAGDEKVAFIGAAEDENVI
jgi:hypothetical protein